MPKPDKNDAIPSLVNKFDVYTEPTHWEIHCPHCGDAWTLKREMPVRVGNVLHLLNHAAGHAEGR